MVPKHTKKWQQISPRTVDRTKSDIQDVRVLTCRCRVCSTKNLSSLLYVTRPTVSRWKSLRRIHETCVTEIGRISGETINKHDFGVQTKGSSQQLVRIFDSTVCCWEQSGLIGGCLLAPAAARTGPVSLSSPLIYGSHVLIIIHHAGNLNVSLSGAAPAMQTHHELCKYLEWLFQRRLPARPPGRSLENTLGRRRSISRQPSISTGSLCRQQLCLLGAMLQPPLSAPLWLCANQNTSLISFYCCAVVGLVICSLRTCMQMNSPAINLIYFPFCVCNLPQCSVCVCLECSSSWLRRRYCFSKVDNLPLITDW